jgi:hypothetical protein
MTRVAPGGPSIINGVLYQILWTLLKTTQLHASACVADEQTGQITQATLRLEPVGGGGDVQEIVNSRRLVQQLKAKSDEGTWSLTEVVKSVLPDLYLAVDLSKPDANYEFVTEGRIGRWGEVYERFESLRNRVCTDDSVLSVLDDSIELRLGIKGAASVNKTSGDASFWPEESYTERRLFERIAQEVRKREMCRTETIETTHRKLWHLLGHFRFVGGQTMQLLKQRVDQYLLELVEYESQVPTMRDALLLGLAQIATKGSADINNAVKYVAEFGLASTPFRAWSVLRERSRALLDGELERLGYDAQDDVRLARARALASMWGDNKPMLAISGNSGQGKSWLLYATAQQVKAGPELIILLEATGNADADLEAASKVCWHEIKRNDNVLPLDRIAERLQRVDADRAHRWLVLFVDGVQNADEARGLAKRPWEKWGVRLLISCEPELASAFEKAARGRCHATESVGDFTTEELQRFLMRSFGESWLEIPDIVRNALRRPLLARLYREIAQRDAWRPTNEFELFKRYWARIDQDGQIEFALARIGLERLAISILDGAPYPWTLAQLVGAELGAGAINALIRVGWIRRAPRERFEVWHDRLLNWAVAEAMVDALRSGELTQNDFCARTRKLCHEPYGDGGRFLGYAGKRTPQPV